MASTRVRRWWRRWVVLVVVFSGGVGSGRTLAQSQPAEPPPVPAVAAKEKVDQAPPQTPVFAKPFTLGVTYYLMSDYVFRGINFSEYDREGREDLNHQMTTALDVPLGKDGKLGTFGFDTFFEWYGGQEALNGNGTNFQEVDFTLRYSYAFDPIKTKATVGWTDYTFPHVTGVGDKDRTNEWFIRLDHNDAWLWRWAGYKGEDGILNPYVLFAQDTGYILGQWYEIGVSHPFAVCKNLTWTPKVTFAFDGGYLEPAWNLGHGRGDFDYAYTQYGMELKYDLTELLHLPPAAGSVFVSGQLFFNDAYAVQEGRHAIQDQLFGGLSVGWTW